MKIDLVLGGNARVRTWLVATMLLSWTQVSQADSSASLPSNSPTGQPAKGLHFAPDPAGGRALALQSVQDYERRMGDNTPLKDDAVPLPQYQLIPSITQGNLDAVATLSSYYYLVKSGNKLVNTVTLAVDPTTGSIRLDRVGLSPSTFIVDALDALAKSELVQAGSYEPRMLRYGSAGPYGTLVLWLKSALGGTDLIYFMQTDVSYTQMAKLQPTKLYTLPEYIAEVRAEAQQKTMVVDSRSAAIAENERKAVSGEDTVTTRLQALAQDLADALVVLKQEPPESIKYFDNTMADITQAQTAVASGLDYVKAHPESNSLASRVRKANYYGMTGPFWIPSGAGTVRAVSDGPNLMTVMKSLRDGFSEMGNPPEGHPILGEIGGIRDRIMRAMVAVNVDLVADNRMFLNPAAVSPSTSPGPLSAFITLATLANGSGNVAHTGSISGTVAPADGTPVVFALITITAVDSINAPAQGRGVVPADLPATFADENGNFVIKNLPPGFYAIMAGGPGRVVVEVKEGVETKLPEPLKYAIRPLGAGAGNGG